MAPELLEGNLNTLGPGIDIWAIEIVFYEVLKGETYFKGIKIVIDLVLG
jgi:serine/threonine protein kinase